MKKTNKAEALENAWKAFENRENALMSMDFSPEGIKRNNETRESLTKALTFVNKNGWIADWNALFEERTKGHEWWR